MASIADIPEYLLFGYMKSQFIEWLVSLYVPWVTKKELLFYYAKYVGVPITSEDMIRVFGVDWQELGI